MQGQQASALIVFFLIFTRVTGALFAAPIYSEQQIPVTVKIGLSAVTAFLFTPEQMQNAGNISQDPAALVVLFAQELLIGLAFAFVFMVVYRAGDMAGSLVGQQIGITTPGIQMAGTNDTIAISGAVYNIIAGLIFLGLDGQHWIFLALGKSFIIAPITQMMLSQQIINTFLPLGLTALEYGFALAFPLLAALLLADFITGLINRAIPALNMFALNLPLKAAASIGVLLITLPYIIETIAQQMQTLPLISLWK